MGLRKPLRIETALEERGAPFSHKYRLMKDRLLNVEYEHWAAGFAEGNNHGKGHIIRVLEYLDLLLGPKPLKYLDRYELFLAMMAILYHDIGLLRQRKGHADISKSLLEGDSNDAYIISPIDKEIIAAAVVSHSSSKDIAQECARFSPEEIIGEHKARPAVVAALVRLADELDEDHRRADPILQGRLKIPVESEFFWLFCQRVRGVRPNLNAKRIDFNLALEVKDTGRYGPVAGTTRHFVAFVAEKLAKINQERVTVNRSLPSELQYAGLHVDVKPLPNHPRWKSPRTFVFNDQTTSQMFLQSYPELLHEPSNQAMQGILRLIREEKTEEADNALRALESVFADLPVDVQMRILYDRACVSSIKAETLAKGSSGQDGALDRAAKYLIKWFSQGEKGAFEMIGRTAHAEVHTMVKDDDLTLVRSKRLKRLQKAIPQDFWPRGGRGCVPSGSLIDTPGGQRRVENVRAGDAVVSLKLGASPERVSASVVDVRRLHGTSCLRLNGIWLVTPTQPVRTRKAWIEAAMLKVGDVVMDAHGSLTPIVALDVIPGVADVFELTIEGPHHNYVANGLLCHNKKA